MYVKSVATLLMLYSHNKVNGYTLKNNVGKQRERNSLRRILFLLIECSSFMENKRNCTLSEKVVHVHPYTRYLEGTRLVCSKNYLNLRYLIFHCPFPCYLVARPKVAINRMKINLAAQQKNSSMMLLKFQTRRATRKVLGWTNKSWNSPLPPSSPLSLPLLPTFLPRHKFGLDQETMFEIWVML